MTKPDVPQPQTRQALKISGNLINGLGQLGKHGARISRECGSGSRLAGVTMDLPLVVGSPDAIGAKKQWVRGEETWCVDFDKCIPSSAEAASCGICIAVRPWTRPDVRPKLLYKMASKRAAEAKP